MVYVPNELGASVTVIDATTLKVVKTIQVGSYPHHVTPAWDMHSLFVNNMRSRSLTVIDPWSLTKVGRVPVAAPYNLYFTPDGTTAILHNRTGGSTDNVNTEYPDVTASAQSLAVFTGKAISGNWSVKVRDLAAADTGTFVSWTLSFQAQ